MATFVKKKKSFLFKIGEQVCFLLQKDKSTFEKAWYAGEIVNLPLPKADQDPVAEVQMYDLFGTFVPKDAKDEWESLALVPFDFPSEVIILSRLSSQTKVENKKSSEVVIIPLKDLCKATESDFRSVLGWHPTHQSFGNRRSW